MSRCTGSATRTTRSGGGLNRWLLRGMTPDAGRGAADQARLHALTQADDLEGVRGLFEAFFAGIPYEWYRRNDLVHYEGCWAGADVFALRGGGSGCPGGGDDVAREARHGGGLPGTRPSLRIQGGEGKAGGPCRGADAGAGLRGQVPGLGRADPAGRHRVSAGPSATSSPSRSKPPERRDIGPSRPPRGPLPRPILADPVYEPRDRPVSEAQTMGIIPQGHQGRKLLFNPLACPWSHRR